VAVRSNAEVKCWPQHPRHSRVSQESELTTQHFNNLTEAQQELLAILAEECSEVIKAVCKIQRHGASSINPFRPEEGTNLRQLETELGHVLCSFFMMRDAGIINAEDAFLYAQEKKSSIKPYLHHQEGM
jgi:NTP pyrophosphatase (non-canonical NTP hydrolase)